MGLKREIGRESERVGMSVLREPPPISDTGRMGGKEMEDEVKRLKEELEVARTSAAKCKSPFSELGSC